MLNRELLERTMTYIKDHPEQHDQASYRSKCGTTMCFAGWALTLNGHVLTNGSEDSLSSTLVDGIDTDSVDVLGNVFGACFTAARSDLGLSLRQAKRLFLDMSADVGRVEAIVKDIMNESEVIGETN